MFSFIQVRQSLFNLRLLAKTIHFPYTARTFFTKEVHNSTHSGDTPTRELKRLTKLSNLKYTVPVLLVQLNKTLVTQTYPLYNTVPLNFWITFKLKYEIQVMLIYYVILRHFWLWNSNLIKHKIGSNFSYNKSKEQYISDPYTKLCNDNIRHWHISVF